MTRSLGRRTVDVASLPPYERQLFAEGCAVMLPGERHGLQRMLVRQLRSKDSKYARAIPTEGAQAVTLCFANQLWLLRAVPVFFAGLIMSISHTGAVRLAGAVLMSCGAAMVTLAFVRLMAARKAGKRFRSEQQTVAAGPDVARPKPPGAQHA